MVSYYGYEIGRSKQQVVKPFVNEIACFFTSLTIKVKLVNEMIQSVYLHVILHVKHKKLPFIAILTWFLILAKIRDGDHSWWSHRPPAAAPPIKYTSSCWEIQRLSTKGKIVSKYCNISKSLGRGSFNPRLYYGAGMIVRPRFKILRQITSTHVLHDKISTNDASVNLPNQRLSCRSEFLPILVCWSWYMKKNSA